MFLPRIIFLPRICQEKTYLIKTSKAILIQILILSKKVLDSGKILLKISKKNLVSIVRKIFLPRNCEEKTYLKQAKKFLFRFLF